MAWTAFIDGGSRGNPGPAAAGVSLLDPKGREAFAGGFFLGRATNNQAEYQALIHALTLLVRAKAPAITIRSDSELLVRQIRGEYRVKSPDLKPLFERARDLLEGWSQRSVEHVPRSRNARADAMANAAMDIKGDIVKLDRLRLVDPQAGRPPKPAAQSKKTPARPVVEARVMRSPSPPRCPAGLKKGQVFEFGDTVPSSLCLGGCAGVLDGVRALLESASQAGPRHMDDAAATTGHVLTCHCADPDCGAVFELRLRGSWGS